MAQATALTVADFGPLVDYQAALRLQEAMVAARIDGAIGDTLLLMEHRNVFTLGRGADDRFIVDNSSKIPVYRVSRGGQVTYHGPGQLVGYPILKLEGRARDVSKYLRDLERAMIDALSRFSIPAGRRDKFTGVWAGPLKIASIGVGIRRWVTYHGFALNVAPDLSYFDAIVPCGIDGCRMTSIAELGRRDVSIAMFSAAIVESFRCVFGYDEIKTASAPEIWRMVDSGASESEAQR